MKREFLKELGLEADLVEQIMTEHGKSIQAEQDKQKAELTRLTGELKKAQDTIDKMADASANAERVKKEADEYKQKFEEVEKSLKAERLDRQIKEQLTSAGGKDLDYLTYKLGDVNDPDKLPEQIEQLKKNLPQHFSAEPADKDKDGGNRSSGYKPLDTGLKDGQPKKLTKADILKISNQKERQQKIAENIELFE